MSVTMSVEWSWQWGREGRKGRVMVRERMCHDSARAAKAAETIAGLAAHTVKWRVVFRGRGWRSGGLADLAFSKRDESTEVAKTGGERAGASAEWHAWTEPDHACPDGRT